MCYQEFTDMPTLHNGPPVSEEFVCQVKGFTFIVMEIYIHALSHPKQAANSPICNG